MGNQSVTAREGTESKPHFSVIRRGHTVCKEASNFRLLPSIEDIGIAAVGKEEKGTMHKLSRLHKSHNLLVTLAQHEKQVQTTQMPNT